MNQLELERAPTVMLGLDDCQRAQVLAQRVHGNLKPTPNYTGLAVPDRFVVGYLGEFGVAAYLRMLGVWCAHHIHTDGNSQPTELVVCYAAGGAPLRLEVKTASSIQHTRLMFPQAQPIDFGVVVAARLDGPGLVSLQGWLSAAEAAALPVRAFPPHTTPTRYRPFAELHPMYDLAMLLERQ